MTGPLHPPFEGQRWRARAACRDTPTSVFFPDRGETEVREARRVCAACPVKAECLEYGAGQAQWQRFGVWGGLTEKERREWLRQRRRERTGQ